MNSLTTIMITIIVLVNLQMNTEEKPRVSEPQKGAPQRIASAALLGSHRELVIVHNGREYRLRLTQNDKLILTA